MLRLWSKKMLSTLYYIFKINPTPADAVVTINGEITNSVILIKGSKISWSVSADGYTEQSGIVVLSEDVVKNVVLEEFLFDTTPVSFDYTGSVQEYVVPDNCTKLQVDCVGGNGGDFISNGNIVPEKNGTFVGGFGGRVECVLNVEPKTILYIYVGGKGESNKTDTSTNYWISGGYNGGGKGSASYEKGNLGGAGGGGATDIRIGGTEYTNRVIVAGAGGGAVSPAAGGAGGGLTGGGGIFGDTNNSNSSVATGGTQTAGGIGGRTGTIKTADGVLGKGGDAPLDSTSEYYGAGGGAGYYGGGSSLYHSGTGGSSAGGGSSYTNATICTDVVHTQGYNTKGNGWLILTPKE